MIKKKFKKKRVICLVFLPQHLERSHFANKNTTRVTPVSKEKV